MERSALIFGHKGQDGYYLGKILEGHGVKVWGVSRRSQDLPCDITNFDSVCQAIKTVRPYYIFNFAANSTTRHEALFENNQTIGTGTCNLLEAVRLFAPKARVFLSGSGLQFVNNGKPLSETSPLDASSPYVAVRNYTYYLAKYFRSVYGLQIYYGFFFTHDSPRRTLAHMSQKIAMAAKRAADGCLDKIEIGALDVRKEYLFAGDAMEAVWNFVAQDNVYELVIGNGKDYSIEDWVERCFSYVGIDWRKFVIPKAGYKFEYQRLVSNPALLYGLGWEPKVSFSDLSRMMMEAL